MKLTKKVIIIISVLLISILGIVFVLSNSILLKSFLDLEEQYVEKETKHTESVLDEIILNMGIKIHDWSSWDDTYEFIENKNKEYIVSNLSPESIAQLGFNIVIFINNDGEIVEGSAIDISTLNVKDLPQELIPYIERGQFLVSHNSISSFKKGLINLPEGVLMVVSRPITNSKSTGAIRGTLIFGRYIDKEIVAQIERITGNVVSFYTYSSTNLPVDLINARSTLSDQKIISVPIDEKKVAGYAVANGINGEPSIIIRSVLSRDIYEQGKKTINAYIVLANILSLVIILAVIFTFQKLVLERISKLTRLLQLKSNGGVEFISLPGKDEFSKLADIINQMSSRIESYAKNLEEKSNELAAQFEQSKNQNATLEETKKATLNVLEDLQVEKQKLNNEKSKDEALLASIGDGVIATDEKGIVTIINKEAEVLLKIKAQNFIGKHFNDVWEVVNDKNEKVPYEERLITKALSTGQSYFDGSFSYQREGVASFPVYQSVAPVVLQGKVVGVINVFRDIAKEKQIDKAKSEFVSLASHQLRTPLTAIKWYVEMLQDASFGELSEKQKEFANEISKGNERMVDLVNALLDVSRIDLGKTTIAPQDMDIVSVAKSIVHEFEPEISNKHIQFNVIYSQDSIPAFLDPRLTTIVFQNIIGNAIKYTPENGSVSVNVNKLENTVKIEVKDSGFGIPESAKDKIFQKLYRAENVQTKSIEGTGLGLYIVKSIVDKSKGTIGFESKENEGTTFTIELPLVYKVESEG